MEMAIHTEPTAEELRGLFRYLAAEEAFGFLGEDLREEGAFVAEFLDNPRVLPMVMEWQGQCIGLVWLSSYEAFPRSAFVHYAVAGRHGREQMAAAAAMLDALLDGPNYNMLYAVFEQHDLASERLSRLFGFEEYARRAGVVYTLRFG